MYKTSGNETNVGCQLYLISGRDRLMGSMGIILLGSVVLAAWLLTKYINKCLGGLTGDTYGATGELIDTWTLLTVLMVQQLAKM
nr:adenosylcobinamide-GDP ribazoletransferase [Desulforamulus aquiferis]